MSANSKKSLASTSPPTVSLELGELQFTPTFPFCLNCTTFRNDDVDDTVFSESRPSPSTSWGARMQVLEQRGVLDGWWKRATLVLWY